MGVPVVGTVMKKVFGTRNDRMVKRYLRIVDLVSVLEPEICCLTDAELRAKTDEFKERLSGDIDPQDMIPEVFAVAREVMDRTVGIRNIFNPANDFDPSELPEPARSDYEKVKATIAETPDLQPFKQTPEGTTVLDQFRGSTEPVPSWMVVDIPNSIYEAIRELHPESRPPYRARPFDVQIIGAVVLYEGRIAEMKTGEGKTIVAPLATYLAVLQSKQVHVVTVNDYLVQRDRDWVFPFFQALGLTIGAIHPMHMQPPQIKQLMYSCDVVYGTTSEFGFDYLRDNMKLSAQEQVQKHRDFAIVDEVDSTLIDEARTPLIISGAAHQDSPRYELADKLARYLVEQQKEWNDADLRVQSAMVAISSLEGDVRNTREKSRIPEFKQKIEEAKARVPELEDARDEFIQYYEVELDKKKATITHEGIAEAQKEASIGSFYVGENMDLPHLLEQAIRAHAVYQRDKDYVVAPDDRGKMSVVIVDQNTGRKMVGRQWSDGLHQAVEAKERVPIKEETQTMATITIQNFFKLYDKLAGMTGTADTEATEFYEIYKLDVVVIPTNVPVERNDHNDLVFVSVGDKWDAIVDEVKAFHDAGRPILVGTTSVENSEMLGDRLTKKYNIKHEILNAKQHEREADIILGAGRLGAVMIATNMAGRGTDIKLQPFTPKDLLEHWKRRGLCPADVNDQMSEEEAAARIYRHIAPKECGLSKQDVEAMSDDEVFLSLLRAWGDRYCWNLTKEASELSREQLMTSLDEHGACMLHRLRYFTDAEDLGGLHVIGTERHESRRIDNQLRGRSGRQGDNGSSRFFLSLEDDLMKMFAGKTTLNLLSKLGMKEGDRIEHTMLTKAVGRAQRKVEERNFLWRKQILEYDEVMDHQRHVFYAMRQGVLEGKEIKELIFDQIGDSVRDAVYTYLDRNYVSNCIGEWIRENIGVTIDSERIRGKDREDLHRLIQIDAKEDALSMIELTLNEYLPEINDDGGETWDAAGLATWANSHFDADASASELQGMSRREMLDRLDQAAQKKIDTGDLAPLDVYLVPHYGEKELVKWAHHKFAVELAPEEFANVEDLEDAADKLMEHARKVYERREVTYPIEFALDMTTANLSAADENRRQYIEQFCRWVKSRYELNWTPDNMPSTDPRELGRILLETAEGYDDAKIADRVRRAVAAGPTPEKLDEWFRTNCFAMLTPEQLEEAKTDPEGVADRKIREIMRAELTHFERAILLQIVDQAWKDHLHSMDQLREAIGLRAFSQKDPRIEFKREGGRLFDDMHVTIRDKVTDLVYKGKFQPRAPQRRTPAPDPNAMTARGPQDAPAATGAGAQRQAPRPAQPATAAAAAAVAGSTAQRRDLAAAERAGTGGQRPRQQPRRAAPAVGRNEPCPCGSGKKYKQCCGKK